MKIFQTQPITEIISALRSGAVVVLPSETSYGLSCDATDQAAVERIFAIKGREAGKAVLVLVDSVRTARKYLKWNKNLEQIAQKYWTPEQALPLTVVGDYHKKFLVKKLAPSTISTQKTLAVRVTVHPLLRELCQRLGRPIVSTSANIAGAAPLYDPSEIRRQFSGRSVEPEAIVDAGVLPARPGSTIVSVVGDEFRVLRQGGLKLSREI